MPETSLAMLIFDNLRALFNDNSIDFYLEGESDFSFSVPILEFDFKYKDKDDSGVKKSTLNIAIEVRFQPSSKGLQISHRVFLYKPDTKEFVEPSGFVGLESYDYKDITPLILDDYDFSDIQSIKGQKLTKEVKTLLSDGFKLKSASENIYGISDVLIQQVKSKIISLGVSINKIDIVEERDEYSPAAPHFDTSHIYLLSP